MTNKEKYQRAFSVLHASDEFRMEVNPVKQKTRKAMPRLVAVCAAVILVIGMSAVAYAADVGGIQRTIQIWLHGEQTDAVLEIQDGEYSLTYEDADGSTHEISGGGVAFDNDGQERPLTDEEIMEHLNGQEVDYKEDGSVWVYYMNQALEVTDLFENGVCYVQLKDGDGSLYMTIKYNRGHATSPHKYLSPDSFNTSY